MFIELKAFTLPAGAAIRGHGRDLQARAFGLLWDADRGVVWVVPKAPSREPVRAYPATGGVMEPMDPTAALEACGYDFAAPKPTRQKKAG
jgi:hypothetical protein